MRMSEDVRDLVRFYLPNFPVRRVRRLVTDTTDFSSIDYGDVVHLGGQHYMVLRDEAERRFGIEDFKFWVKRCKVLETGESAILKLVFHEEFLQQLGDITIRSYRSPAKEARILEMVKDDHRFMHGFSITDDQGNLVRVIKVIRGKRFDLAVSEMGESHRDYFDNHFAGVLGLFIDACEAIAWLHSRDERHGDIRRDHLWLEPRTGMLRWIDFDYAYDLSANPFALDLAGLGNILAFLVGRQVFRPPDLEEMGVLDKAEPGDFNLVFRNRFANLRKVFPHVPEDLNRVVMHFSAGTEVFYETVDEFLADLRPCLDSLPKGG